MSDNAPLTERIARAIYEGRNGHGCKPWSHQPKAHKYPYLMDALVALKAMRTPTFNMVEAPALMGFGPDEADDIWTSMIDAAIQEHSNLTRQSS